MGEPTLRVIAHELVTVIKSNMSVDWMHREVGASQYSAACEAPAPKVRLPARLAGRGGAERLAAGRGVVGGMGGVIPLLPSPNTCYHRSMPAACRFPPPWIVEEHPSVADPKAARSSS